MQVKLLRAYAFPGNVRELENILERALTLCDGDVIGPDDLQLPAHATDADGAAAAEEPAPEPGAAFALEDDLADVERSVVIKALEKTGYNKTAAAQILGISFRALRYKLKKLDME